MRVKISFPVLFFLLISMVCSISPLIAQPFGNEWINSNMPYYKISVTGQGIFRLGGAALETAGVPISTINPASIRFFRNGQEYAIRLEGQADGVFDAADFIEFYANSTNADSDIPYYTQPQGRTNPYHKIYSDQDYFFMSWGGQDGLRLQTLSSIDENAPLAQADGWAMRIFPNEYCAGNGFLGQTLSNVFISEFVEGEGLTGSSFSNFNRATIFNDINQTQNRAGAKVEIIVNGRNGAPHNTRLWASAGSVSVSLDTLRFSHYVSRTKILDLPQSLFNGAPLSINVQSLALNGQDRISITSIKVTYPRSFDLQNYNNRFLLIPPTNTTTQIQWQNAGSNVVIYDVSNPALAKHVLINNTNNKSGLPARLQGTSLFVSTPTLLDAGAVQKAAIRNFSSQFADYIIISNSKLRVPIGQTPDPVIAFGAYRASNQGGNHDTLIVNIQTLYDVFGYGEPSPFAIKRFCQYLLARTGQKPQYLFIIGKGLQIDHRRPLPLEWEANNLVPTYGYPPSDNIFAQAVNESEVQKMAVGRLAALTSADIMNYLAKVQQHEIQPANAEWRKKLIHLSGGKTQEEVSRFKLYITEFKKKAEGKYLFGSVRQQHKSTTVPIEVINLAPDVNQGVAMINVLGHSTSQLGPDMELGLVSNPGQGYNNIGKYPIVIINGCYTGLCFFPGRSSLNEDWILTPNKGAIGFFAHVNEGLDYTLYRYTDSLYSRMFEDSARYGEPVAVSIMRLNQSVQRVSLGISDPFNKATTQQMLWHGDPAIRMIGTRLPDFQTQNSQVQVITPNIEAQIPSFKIAIQVKNLGKYVGRPVEIRLQRIIESENRTISYPPIFHRMSKGSDTVVFNIDNTLFNARVSGFHRFEVSIDPLDSISEYQENNNEASLRYFFPQSGVKPLMPYEYAIVSSNTVNFVAGATDLSTNRRTFYFEADTSASFSSSLLQSRAMQGSALGRARMSFTSLPDSTVIFWRVRLENDMAWQNSSFILIPNSPTGWAQSHFFQFSKSTDLSIRKDSLIRKWALPAVSINLQVTSVGVDTLIQITDIRYNNTTLIRSSEGSANCLNGPFRFLSLTIDKNSLNPYNFPYTANFWQFACGREPRIVNFYDQSQIALISNYLDFVRPGDYAMLMSSNNINYGAVLANPVLRRPFLQKLHGIGADTIAFKTLQHGEPFIILGRKGFAPGSAVEYYPIAGSISKRKQVLRLNENLQSQPPSGSITSSEIGPALAWTSVFYKLNNDNLGQDNYKIQVLGRLSGGRDTVLINQVPYSGYPIGGLINAANFPYLRLRAILSDSTNFTPPQLKNWIVVYKSVPEGIINTSLTGINPNQYQINDKQEGESFDLQMGFENISQVPFPDSLLVLYQVKNQNSSRIIQDSIKIRPLAGQDSIVFKIPNIKTTGMKGLNNLQIFVNPYKQPEQQYTNNLFATSFNVLSDRLNPVLDLTFDGVRIMDGDLISPQPVMIVSLKDENKFLFKNERSGLNFLIKKPGSATFTSVDLFANNVKIDTASAQNKNTFQLTYRPDRLEDGDYQLRVQGPDASGNASGGLDYTIGFKVINASTITHFFPYPNPFSTSTRFVFTLTGMEIPEDIRIQIMTLTGRIVREITREELGPIRIGNNISQYSWNGTDEFGDRLANGVYLYKVVVRHQNQNLEHRQTDADKFFKHNFGKLYLIR